MKLFLKFKKILFFLALIFTNNCIYSQSWQRFNDSVLFHYNNSDYQIAIVFAEKAVLEAKKEFGISDSRYEISLYNLADLYEVVGKYQKAVPLYLEALKLTEQWLGENDSLYLIRQNNLAALYTHLGQNEKALALYLEALTKIEKSLGKKHSNYGTLLNNLAELYQNMSQYEKALPLYLEALENVEKSQGKAHPNYGTRLNNLASLYTSMGLYEKALPLYLEALTNAENNFGKAHSSYGMRLNNLGQFYTKVGQYERALPLYLEALINAENNFGKAHSSYGTRLNNLAELYRIMGLYEKALPLFIEALTNAENNFGKAHSNYGIYLNNLAKFYMDIGQFEKSLLLYLQVLEVTEKNIGKDHPNYGQCLNDLAALYTNMGQYENALPLFLEALEITIKTIGKDHIDYGQRLSNLAVLYTKTGQNEKALPLYLEAISNAEKSLGKAHSDYGIRLNNLAHFYVNNSQYKEALPLFLEASHIFKKSFGKSHPSYGVSLNNLALLYKFMQRYQEAEPLYLEALAIAKNTVGKNHSYYGNILINLASLYSSMGKNEIALPLFLEAESIIITNIENNFSYLSERDKLAYMATAESNFIFIQGFFFKYFKYIPEIPAKAFDLELSSSNLILNSLKQIKQNIENSGDEKARKEYEEWVNLKFILAKYYTRSGARDTSYLKTIEERADILEGNLARISSTFNKTLKRVNWSDIQQKLKSNEVVIQFSSFDFYNGKSWTDSTIYVALVLRKGDTYPSMIPLCETSQLDSLLKKENTSDANFISQLYRGADIVNKNKAFSYGKRLYELVWKPLDSLLAKGDKVYFAPSGLLHQIAFAAIPYSKDSLLSDRYTLNQLSSTAILLKESPFKETKPESMTVFGGINYDASEKEILEIIKKDSSNQEFVSRSLPSDLTRSETFSYLPGALTESKEITTIAKANKIKVNSYSGLAALEETYKKIGFGKSPQVLHISTHGFFFPDPKTEKQKDFDFGDEGKTVFKYSDDPLNRAGLLFSGANNTWAGKPIPNVEDGILTAYEAANVSLSNTQLVVLSACETGLGDIKGSEGVFGLQRAFKMAGAEYLMMSLWKVPDTETAEFMTQFYTTWFKGKTIPDAFTSTQNYMKLKYPKDPYKWAAFVLVK